MKTQLIYYMALILFLTTKLSSQNTTYEYLLSTPLNESLNDMVELQDGSIYFTGKLSNADQPKRTKALVAKLDKSGNLVDSLIFTYPNKGLLVNRIFQTQAGDFDLVTSIYDTINYYQNSGIVLYKMDEQLNLSDTTVYYFPPNKYISSVTANIVSDGNILAGISLRTPPQNPRAYLYVFNSDFDSLKANYYPNEAREICHIHSLPDGNFWWLDLLRDRYEIADTSLNIIASQDVPDFIHGNFGIKWDTDTTFYLSGEKIFTTLPYTLSFIRQYHPIDTTGHLFNQWHVSDTVDFPAVWNGLDFQKKDSIFIGGTRNLNIYNPWFANQPSWFVLLQTDSMLNIRWERFYGGDAYYVMCKVLATHDGGCLVAGTRYDYLNTTELETDIIILKLNSEGLITSKPEHPAIEMHEAIVYPNPGNEIIKVRIAVQYKQSVFELFDMNGRPVLKENFSGTEGTANTTFLPHGTYVYRITSPDGLFESGKWVKE